MAQVMAPAMAPANQLLRTSEWHNSLVLPSPLLELKSIPKRHLSDAPETNGGWKC